MAEDRTSEFLALVRSLPEGSQPTQIEVPSTLTSGNVSGRYNNNRNNNNNNSNSNNDSSYAQLRDFHTTAAGISRDIAATSSMLKDLTQLVKQKSLFQDDTAKVNDLVVHIKASIENLNGRLDAAGRQIAQQKRTLGKNSQPAQEATNMVGQLQEEFGQAAAGFKTILQQRTNLLKETTDRKRDIYGAQEDVPVLNLENRPPVYNYDQPTGSTALTGFPTLDLTSGMTAGEPTGSQLPRPHGVANYETSSSMRLRHASTSDSIPTFSGSASSYYGRQNSTPLTPWDIQRMEQESGQDQLMQLIPDQDYLRERADAMEQVESNIVELGTIFNRLAVMVNEHKDMVQRVEDNVDEANSMINLSLNTLTDTLTNLQTNRALFFKVFSILVVFIISFIIFFA
ncbi:syntaxin [Nitzschia inconspicua]|uniref:Syntaxin n=1 Tax=Nitzschia inconspicua TaxID=303405 RepID=A0A9K3L8S5_9STRA|nr:syntaxin [Nitzschia inconspicua]